MNEYDPIQQVIMFADPEIEIFLCNPKFKKILRDFVQLHIFVLNLFNILFSLFMYKKFITFND